MEKLIRSLCKQLAFVFALLPVFAATGAFGASIEWQSLQGRERIVISKAMSDGIKSDIARIDAKGIAIPFVEMPGGLVIGEQPANASIIQGTAQFGQTLVILTQTPKFGFVVSQRTPTQITIDFFPDELGARWKPEEASGPIQPVQTAQAPQPAQAQETQPAQISTATPSAVPAMQSPQGTGGNDRRIASVQGAQTALQGAAPQPATPVISPATASTPPATTAGLPSVPPAPLSSPPLGWQEQPVSTNAPVLTADGRKPIADGAQGTPIPVVSLPEETAPTPPLPENVLLDTRQDTATRSAALPAPGLDSSLVGQPAPSVLTLPGDTSSDKAPSAQTGARNAHQQPGAQQIASQQAAPVQGQPGQGQPGQGQSGAQPISGNTVATPNSSGPSSTAVTAQNAPVVQIPDVVQLPSEPARADDDSMSGEQFAGKDLMRGVGVRVAPNSYRGIFNPSGMEGIENFADSGAKQTPEGAPSSRPQEGQQPRTAPLTADDTPPANAYISPQTPLVSDVAPASPEKPAQPSSPSSVRLVVEDSDAGQSPAGQQAPGQAAGQSTGGSGQGSPEQEEVEQATASTPLEAPASLGSDEDVIYVNEAGEEIVPPADPEQRLEEIRALMAEKKYAEANDLTMALLAQTNLSKLQRENALHIRAEALFFLHRDNFEQYGASIIEATDLAINANPRSPKNAVALLRLGYINLQLENVPEAEARFNMLRRMFPNDENVPLSYYYWGDYFYDHDELERAIDQFQVVTQKYPGSKYAREASLGLARSFYRLGYYEQAFNIVEYIEQRWPRFYLNYPPFLNMMGDVAFRLNNFDYATRYYWLYVNLEPAGDEVDVILTRIGDIYSLQQQGVAAREVYSEVIERFPDTDGGLIALMRLAEESINDDPTIATMFNAFDNRPVMRPVDVYKKIIAEYPQSKYVSLAQLKLAMWHLWNHDYTTTLDIADAFLRAKPQDELAPKMKEVALKTFAVLSAQSVANGSFSRMRDIWESYPMLQEQEEILTPESRVALGVSYWKDSLPEKALEAVEPFFLGDKIPEYSEMALNLVLQIYLQYDQWSAIEEVARRVSLWEISADNQMQLDYALALAREKMGKPDEAAVLWEKLYDSKRLPDDQMAFATYFLARDAEKRQRNDEAYLLGVEALKRLQGEAEKNPDQADTAKIKTQISSLMSLTEEGGRLGESLEYAAQYMQYLPEGDPDRAGVIFRMARINKKQGNEALWRERMTEVARSYPDTVYGQTANAALKSTDLEKAASAYSPQR